MDALTVDVGDAALSARTWPGSGRPVLLVHGLSSNARLWDQVASVLSSSGHPVAAVDLRGHGASHAAPDTDLDPTVQAARDLAEVCTSLGWASPVVAGQSWGGNVVLQLAADQPSRVHGLALVDGGWLSPSDRWATVDDAWAVLAPPVFEGMRADDLLSRLRAGHPAWSEEAIAATANNLQVRDDGMIAPWLDRERHKRIVGSLLTHRPRELYARVTCPVVLMAAGSSNAAAEEAAAMLPNAQLVTFPGGDHDLHAQQPERVAELIQTLL